MDIGSGILIDFFAAAIRIASPLMLAALGGVITERAGVFAISLEGFMLFGAFTGVIGAFYSDSVLVGILTSALGGALLALMLATATVTFRADQIVCTIAVNIFAFGMTSFLLRIAFGTGDSAATRIASIPKVPIPGLVDIPYVGPILFNHQPLTYVAYIMVPVTAYFLFRTGWGLNIRAVGENPRAVHTVGISPWTTRYISVVLSGFLAGLGGAVLSLQQVGFFTENMTQGRGFIALAAVIFGRWNPWMVAGACLLFGAAEALQLRIQAFGLPISSHIVLMFPYVIAIVALMGFGLRAKYPAAIGRPYSKEDT